MKDRLTWHRDGAAIEYRLNGVYIERSTRPSPAAIGCDRGHSQLCAEVELVRGGSGALVRARRIQAPYGRIGVAAPGAKANPHRVAIGRGPFSLNNEAEDRLETYTLALPGAGNRKPNLDEQEQRVHRYIRRAEADEPEGDRQHENTTAAPQLIPSIELHPPPVQSPARGARGRHRRHRAAAQGRGYDQAHAILVRPFEGLSDRQRAQPRQGRPARRLDARAGVGSGDGRHQAFMQLLLTNNQAELSPARARDARAGGNEGKHGLT